MGRTLLVKIYLYLVESMGVLTQTRGNTLRTEPKRTQRVLPRNSLWPTYLCPGVRSLDLAITFVFLLLMCLSWWKSFSSEKMEACRPPCP